MSHLMSQWVILKGSYEGYPPDKERRATETVLQQAELLSDEWAPV